MQLMQQLLESSHIQWVPTAFCLLPFCVLNKDQANAAIFSLHFSQHTKTVTSLGRATFSSGDGDWADSPFCGYVLLKLARLRSTSERVLKILKTVRAWTLSCFVTPELFLFCILLKNVFSKIFTRHSYVVKMIQDMHFLPMCCRDAGLI